MERLTRRNEKGIAVLNIRCPEWCEHATCSPEEGYQCQHQCEGDIIDKLAIYEDAEEQGLLMRLPCKVGDTVWVVTSPFNVFDDIEYDEDMKDEVYEAFVSSVTFYKSGEQYRIYAKATNHFIGAYFRKCDFGKTVFLTREEAEAKLKEMEGEDA